MQNNYQVNFKIMMMKYQKIIIKIYYKTNVKLKDKYKVNQLYLEITKIDSSNNNFNKIQNNKMM